MAYSSDVGCTSCGHENREKQKFCVRCGAALARGCARCGTPCKGEDKFCGECGASLVAGRASDLSPPRAFDSSTPLSSYTPKHLADKILTSRSALEGERKQVTVLFADVKGSMELAEQLDAEEWHRLLERFFDILTESVHRFEGTINQYTGDGVMALFGAPIAHEDHAQRAAFAALRARDRLRTYADELRVSRGLNFSARIGINTGEVVVGKIGDDLRMDYTAQGRAVGLAARMEQLAEPGRVLMTEHTAKLVSGYFVLRDLGASMIKGVSEPLHVYELESIGSWHTRFDSSRARGFSRFVGREHDMAVLQDALARAVDGEGQIVGIVAEAGAGKSRLCFEFIQHCRSRGIEVVSAAAMPHGKSVPFLPVLQILRALCGLSERDGGEDARRKIAGALLMRDESFRDDLPLLFDFLGVGDPNQPGPRGEPEVLQRRLFDVIQRLIHTRDAGGPSVLLFEDLHWIDGASAAALARLIETVPKTRTLLLLNFRPEYSAAWMQSPHYRQLPLRALTDGATVELLQDLLGPDPNLAPLMERVQERAAGNPFFIEELVQSLAEAGGLLGTRGAYRPGCTTAPVLPATVQATLAARIDRLTEAEKGVLQAAAVIGREFHESVLQQVAERSQEETAAALHALGSGEFIYNLAHYPEVQYAFKHPLTQEVAYRSQLSERRACLHAATARAMQALYPDKLDENAALLAQHWERAGDAVVAAEWHSRAAGWVGARDRSEMLRHWQQVQQLLAHVAAKPETLRLRLLSRIQILHNGLLLGQAHENAAAIFREAKELATELGDISLHIWLLGEYAMVQQQIGSIEEGLVHTREGIRLADTSGVDVLRLMMRVPLTWLLLQSGQLREAVTASDEAEAIADGDIDAGTDFLGFSPIGSILTLRASALTFLGRLDEARHEIERATEIGRRRNDAEVLSWANSWAVNLYEVAGRPHEALHHARQAVEFGESLGSAGMRADAYLALTRAHLLNDEPAEALTTIRRARDVAGAHGAATYVEPFHLVVHAQTHLALGNFARARELVEQAMHLAQDRPTTHVVALLMRARLLMASEGASAGDAIESSLRLAAILVESMHARGLAPFIPVEHAELARLRGDQAGWRRSLQEALDGFSSLGATGHAERARRALAAFSQ